MFKTWMKKSFIIGMSFTILAPSLSHAFGEASVIQQYVGRDTLVPLIKPSWGNFVLHTQTLNKFYSLRNHQAVWVDAQGKPNAMVNTLRNILLTADRHGLSVGDYWDADVESLYNAAVANPNVWITFELAATEAMIRYVSHLSTGRFDPTTIDADIRFKKKEFNDYVELNAAVSYGAASLEASLDNFAPSYGRYKDLVDMLTKLRGMKSAGGWETLTSPGFALKLNVSDPIIMKLRARLNAFGYTVSNAGGNLFDAEFDAALRKFQTQNGLSSDGIIGTKSEVLRALNFTVGQRISQVEATMEKLRWLPRTVESRHIFVNLGTTEFRLYDEGSLMFYFRTVNGAPIHRTPSMRDKVSFVNLNPYWTVPESIFMRAKLPEIKKNPSYFQQNNFTLINERTGQEVNSFSIDWRTINTKGDFRRLGVNLRQNPGVGNALGVVKFPLVMNTESIYMHDTNEKNLFAEKERHRSSGCVRLQQPLELAAYLLRDNAGWDINAIRAQVPFYSSFIPGQWDQKIYLKKEMPVYMLYLTAEKGEGGEMRFVDDVYGQDLRVSKAVQNKRVGGELF